MPPLTLSPAHKASRDRAHPANEYARRLSHFLTSQESTGIELNDRDAGRAGHAHNRSGLLITPSVASNYRIGRVSLQPVDIRMIGTA